MEGNAARWQENISSCRTDSLETVGRRLSGICSAIWFNFDGSRSICCFEEVLCSFERYLVCSWRIQAVRLSWESFVKRLHVSWFS